MATYFFLSVFGSFVGLREPKLVEEKSLNLKWLFSQFELAEGWPTAGSSCLVGWFSTNSSQPIQACRLQDLKLELLSTILLYLPRMNFTPGYKRFHRNHLEPMDFLEIPLAPDVLISHTNG